MAYIVGGLPLRAPEQPDVYTKTQICAHFGISPRLFTYYRQWGIVGPPTKDGTNRYYSNDDIKRIRDARTHAHDDRLMLREYAQRFPRDGDKTSDEPQIL